MPREIIKFMTIIGNGTYEDFDIDVNESISEGWQPWGTCYMNCGIGVQHMVKYKPIDPNVNSGNIENS